VLEEKEREDFFRLKVLKKKKLRRALSEYGTGDGSLFHPLTKRK
jgi:hypothetical protein